MQLKNLLLKTNKNVKYIYQKFPLLILQNKSLKLVAGVAQLVRAHGS